MGDDHRRPIAPDGGAGAVATQHDDRGGHAHAPGHTTGPLPVPAPPPLVPGEIRPDPPPEAPEPRRTPLLRALLPVVMLVAVVGMVAVMVASGAARNPMTFLFPVIMVVSTLGMLAGGASGGTDLGAVRRGYQRHLAGVRRAIGEATAAQRARARHDHPDPGDLWSVACGPRLWTRRAGDGDFGLVRIGRGTQEPATPVVPPDVGAPETLDPVGATALRAVLRPARAVPDLPVSLQLTAFPVVSVAGDAAASRAAVRAWLAQLATFHHPADVAVAAVAPGPEWDALKWLPHHRGAGGVLRPRPGEPAAAVLDRVPEDAAHVVVLVDGAGPADAVDLPVRDDVTLLQSAAAPGPLRDAARERGLALTVRDGRLVAATAAGEEDFAEADALGPRSADALFRRLPDAPGRAARAGGDGRDPVLAALGADPPPERLDPAPRLGAARLRVPVGVDPSGAVVHLDVKEAAEGGVGPHGLCIGATGSGKSEALRTIVLAMAATHPPEQLNLVLVDFKGGATFLGLEELPHVSAVITNLADELVLVDRMQDAIAGEMTRRQELLRAAGNFQGVSAYEAARRAGRGDLAPLPALLIVVDEFSELLGHRPEFADLFVAVGRLGRSLHMHLLLASQRLEEGRLRGLDSHLSYRIGLKTFSAAESRTVLGVPDAHLLPPEPGTGYLKTDAGPPRRFRAAYVSGPVRGGAAAAGGAGAVPRVRPFTAEPDEPEGPAAPAAGDAAPGAPTTLDAAVAALRHLPGRAHRVWLPPLPPAAAPAELPADPAGPRPLTGAIGLVDNPLQQRQDPEVVDLTGAGGHVAVVGAPRSGKTTALRTLVLALARTTTSAQLEVSVIDYGAGGLADLAALPHVRSVAHRGDADRLRRTIADAAAEIAAREARCRARGWHSAEAARAAGVPDLLLVVDGFPALRAESQDLADRIQAIVADGLAVGVHVALSAHRWTELRPAVRDLLGTRVELRQAEAIDSVHDRKAAARVPKSPGRGLAAGGLALLVARTGPADTREAAAAARARGDRDADPLRLLPERVTPGEVLAAPGGDAAVAAGRVPLGLDEDGLAAVSFDPARHRHLAVLGSAGSGRTTALRTAADGLRAARSSMKFVVVDYRRGLLGHVPADRLAGYAGSSAVAEPMIAELAGVLRGRLPAADITPERLAARDWWEGPELAVVVDDYDLVAGARGNPLAPLAEFIPHAADIGLHLVLARRIGGALRALHDPVFGGIRDQGAAALVLDGAREDGPVFGVLPDARPPGRGHWAEHGRPARLVQVAAETADAPATGGVG
ncbi:type VII secretion protein EccCa [Corynebacterium sp. 335C]